MPSEQRVIDSVSDTARWVAVYRAMETERPDALFHDRFARALAGDRGHAIVDELPGAGASAWGIAVRTAVFDEMILRAVRADGVDTILDLAAGLDARPYRLSLPPDLRWVEVDLPGIIQQKEQILGREHPCCEVQRIALDLADVDARREAFARATAGSRRTMVLSEGLVMYLRPEHVASLASDLSETPAVCFWATDMIGPAMKIGMNVVWHRALSRGDATFHFGPREGARFFEPYGWRVREYRAGDEEAFRLKRAPRYVAPWAWLRRMPIPGLLDFARGFAAFVWLERSDRK